MSVLIVLLLWQIIVRNDIFDEKSCRRPFNYSVTQNLFDNNDSARGFRFKREVVLSF